MSTEISTQTQARGLALQSFDDAFRFAKMVASSEYAPKEFRGKPESCMLAIQHGGEAGLTPMQSLQSIAVINGRPSIWGDAALALCMASHVCEFVKEDIDGEGDAMTAVCAAKRRGYTQATVAKFSVADAKKAGLWGKSGPWTQYPRRMLQLRARGFALRDAFPDVLKGLVTAEEAQDYQTPVVDEPAPGRPTVIKATAKPATTVPDDAMGKARLAVSKCDSINAAERLRTLMDERLADGVFTKAQHDELVQLLRHRVEMLIGDDAGQEHEHEAAEHEVQA